MVIKFTDYGYVRDTQESFTEYYDGDRENIPDEYRVMDLLKLTPTLLPSGTTDIAS